MSAENAELVRHAFGALQRGSYPDAARALHADAVWHNTAEFPGPRQCVGRQAIVDFWAILMEDFDETAATQTVERLVEHENAVLVSVHSVGRGGRATCRSTCAGPRS
jgi:ketosteroid isomerase-like protein